MCIRDRLGSDRIANAFGIGGNLKSNYIIRGIFFLIEVERRNQNEILFTHNLTIEIKNVQKPAIVCEWLNLSIFKSS